MAVLNSSTDAVLAVDGEGQIALANAAAERLFSRSQEELVGSRFAWAMPDEQVLGALKASHDEARPETRLVERPRGQHLQVTAAPITGGGEWAALVVFHDVTEARRLEETRRDFVANVSHELRTPLAAIKSVIETLSSGALDDRAAAQDFLSRADAEVERLVQIVEELLELSRLESGQAPLAKESVDMGAVLTQAVERLRPQAEKQGLSLGLEVSPDLPSLVGDGERLERAVVSLIDNAVKFTPSGGSVSVSASFRDDAVTVEVSDTGVGIASEDLPHVFERFYKADRARGGTGLGLAVVKHTVEAHGGSVGVESEPGKGSTFRFSIPTTTTSSDT
jgi:two-component system phosphate regulon sensor histidine kinase PhoR